MEYRLGAASEANLRGVHPALIAVVRHAITITRQDFAVVAGARTIEQQERYVRLGVSKTLQSKHLPQHDGYAHAIDLVPYFDGGPRWEWDLIYPIAEAMRIAALAGGRSLTWGGVWDRRLEQLHMPLRDEVEVYVLRHPGPDFLDGPHYQLNV